MAFGARHARDIAAKGIFRAKIERTACLVLHHRILRGLELAFGDHLLGVRFPWLGRLGRCAGGLERAKVGDQRPHVGNAKVLENFRRHPHKVTSVMRHSGAKHALDIGVAIFGEVAASGWMRNVRRSGAALKLWR